MRQAAHTRSLPSSHAVRGRFQIHYLRANPFDHIIERARSIYDLVQQGYQADDWKPMQSIGAGVQEIRIQDAAGAFHVIYVAKSTDAVYVLHCFMRTTQKTSRTDLDLAARRYRELTKELGK